MAYEHQENRWNTRLYANEWKNHGITVQERPVLGTQQEEENASKDRELTVLVEHCDRIPQKAGLLCMSLTKERCTSLDSLIERDRKIIWHISVRFELDSQLSGTYGIPMEIPPPISLYLL